MPSLLLRTTTWRSANAATCGRCVTTSTWADLASAASRLPISTAALPPTPASTSSKTNVGTGRVSARATSIASITRDSSPPEAPLVSGRGSEPVLAASTSSTSSTPLEVNRSRALPISRPFSSSTVVEPHLEPGVRHRQRVQLGGHRLRQPRARLAGAAVVSSPASLRERPAQLLPLGAQLRDPLVGAVQAEQPLGGGPRPLEDLVDRLAVLPGQRGQRCPPLGDRGQPGGVGLHPRGVGRHVGRHVGEQVADLGDPVGQRGDLRVVLAHALERAAGGGHGAQRVGGLLVRRERLAGGLGGRAQRVGETEPRLLGRQRLLLAALRVDGLDLLEPEPQHVGLAGAFARGAEHLAQLGLDRAQPREARLVAAEHRGQPGAGKGVERVALGLGPQQSVLVGLAVHRDEHLAHAGERGRGHRGAAEEGP